MVGSGGSSLGFSRHALIAYFNKNTIPLKTINVIILIINIKPNRKEIINNNDIDSLTASHTHYVVKYHLSSYSTEIYVSTVVGIWPGLQATCR